VRFFRRFRRAVRQKPAADWLIAGFGNPGPDYSATRHNYGFLAADVLVEMLGASFGHAEIGGSLSAHCRISASSTVLVIKPQTFMNRSGDSVETALDTLGLDAKRLIVLVDDLALRLGSIRIRKGGGDGGHNGLRSTIERLGTGEVIRVRMGIGPAKGVLPSAPEWVDYVLGMFDNDEKQLVGKTARRSASAVRMILTEGMVAAMNHFNRREINSESTTSDGQRAVGKGS